MSTTHTILSNEEILTIYTSGRGESITVDTLRKHNYLNAWRHTSRFPDYKIKNAQYAVDGGETTYWGCIRAELDELTRPLEFNGRRVCVRPDRFQDWQENILEQSPLTLLAYRISKVSDREDRNACLRATMTAGLLPGFVHPLLEAKLAASCLADIHLHLNGSTLADEVWEQALGNPREFRRTMLHAVKDGPSGAEELFSQCSTHFNWRDQAPMVGVASALRTWLVRRLYLANKCPVIEFRKKTCPLLQPPSSHASQAPQCAFESLCIQNTREYPLQTYTLSDGPLGEYTDSHPVTSYFPASDLSGTLSPFINEAYFLTLIFDWIHTTNDDYLARCLHYYLLLKNFMRKLLVQQPCQIGFDQFQKITLTGIREQAEQKYFNRCMQFEEAARCKKIYVEGRFAPKKTYRDLRRLLAAITRDWNTYTEKKNARTGGTELSLSLVAHFIKEKDDGTVPDCQHYLLRRRLYRQARLLMLYLKERESAVAASVPQASGENGCPRITGFDAAASELDTPPEVFAPTFRYLRSEGFNRFTYHAGEDFPHLVSGIRAVEEAVRFLELGSGNRIGHATALGINPHLWIRRIGGNIHLRKLQWLDDLVYACGALNERSSFAADLCRLEKEVYELSTEIYGRAYTLQQLHAAWELRQLDPLVAFFDFHAGIIDGFGRSEWERVRQAKHKDPEAFELFRRYHSLAPLGCKNLKKSLENASRFRPCQTEAPGSPYGKCSARQVRDAFITVPADVISPEALRYLQERMLARLTEKGIAIEALISSNTRISFYENYAEHHVLHWLGIGEKAVEKHPVVCLGTDDPGIFATSLRNEYLHLYLMLKNAGLDDHSSLKYLEEVLENSRAYLFDAQDMLAGWETPDRLSGTREGRFHCHPARARTGN